MTAAITTSVRSQLPASSAGLKHKHLAHKPCRQRQAEQAEHEKREREGQRRGLKSNAVIVVKVGTAVVFLGKQGNYPKAPRFVTAYVSI